MSEMPRTTIALTFGKRRAAARKPALSVSTATARGAIISAVGEASAAITLLPAAIGSMWAAHVAIGPSSGGDFDWMAEARQA